MINKSLSCQAKFSNGPPVPISPVYLKGSPPYKKHMCFVNCPNSDLNFNTDFYFGNIDNDFGHN